MTTTHSLISYYYYYYYYSYPGYLCVYCLPVVMLGRRKDQHRKTIESLPWSVVRKLTQLLDRPHPEHHNWSTLLAHTEVVGKFIKTQYNSIICH